MTSKPEREGPHHKLKPQLAEGADDACVGREVQKQAKPAEEGGTTCQTIKNRKPGSRDKALREARTGAPSSSNGYS